MRCSRSGTSTIAAGTATAGLRVERRLTPAQHLEPENIHRNNNAHVTRISEELKSIVSFLFIAFIFYF
jgi:hypothetical protein